MSGEVESKKSKKASLAQSDVPSYSLMDALRVPKAIAEELGKQPSTPLQVAAAMGMKPTTGGFRMITAAAIAYGLTDGGAFADKISLTDLGRRIVAPTIEGDDIKAMREAILRPRVTRLFLQKYNGSKWPRNDIGRNVLESFEVPSEQSERALGLIYKDASSLKLLTEINGTEFLELHTTNETQQDTAQIDLPDGAPVLDLGISKQKSKEVVGAPSHAVEEPPRIDNENRKVFITHGKDKTIVEQIKKLLVFGNFEPIVSVERQATAKPVPDKVMDDMRACSAGIVHVGAEMKVIDTEGNEHQMLNPNVLIEIGAAMALYNRRFILLVEKGVALPSNLQGLYEVRYTGSGLDHESTMALLEAFANFKSVDSTTSA